MPTVVESAPDMVSAGSSAPRQPKAAADRRLAERLVRQIIADPEVKKKFADLGYFTTGSTPGLISRRKFEPSAGPRWSRTTTSVEG